MLVLPPPPPPQDFRIIWHPLWICFRYPKEHLWQIWCFLSVSNDISFKPKHLKARENSCPSARLPLPKFLLPLTIPPATQAVKKCVKIDPTSFPGFSPLLRSKSDNPGNEVESTMNLSRGRGGGVLPYMGYIVMCRCEGYGFQTDMQSNLSLRTPLYYGQFVWSHWTFRPKSYIFYLSL